MMRRQTSQSSERRDWPELDIKKTEKEKKRKRLDPVELHYTHQNKKEGKKERKKK